MSIILNILFFTFRENRDRVLFLKKLYQRRDRKASVSSTPAKIHSRQMSREGNGDSIMKCGGATSMQSANASVSPYYMRRSSHASPIASVR